MSSCGTGESYEGDQGLSRQMPNQWQKYYGYGMGGAAVQKHVLSIIGDPAALRHYREQPWFWPST